MRRIISIFVIAIIACSVLTGSVCAGPESSAKYKDIKDSDWYAEAVGKLSALKIIDGLPDGSFNPQGQITKAQFVKMLVQAMEYQKIDSVSFTDLKPFPTSKPHWASVYIETALRNGVIIKAEEGDNFYPDVPLTRDDMAMMMFRALKLTPSNGENPFADITEPNGALIKLYEEYLIRGSIVGGKRLYKPEGLTTRAEASTIIARLVDYKADPAGYVAKTAMEERFKNGTQAAEDIKEKSRIDKERQAADKNYIVEPKISVVKSPGIKYYEKFIYSYIYLDNYTDYADDAQIRAVCITDKTQNSSYGQDAKLRWLETRSDEWKSLAQKKLADNPIIVMVNKGNIRKIGDKYEGYDYNYKSGTVLVYEIQIKRGNTLKKYPVNVVIP